MLASLRRCSFLLTPELSFKEGILMKGNHMVEECSRATHTVERAPPRCGGLIRDVIGNWLIGFIKVFGVCYVVDVELRVSIGFFYAWNSHIRSVVVETDSLKALHFIQDDFLGLVLHIQKIVQLKLECFFSTYT
ncbi:hypothetical protein V6N12_043263 [Hibiscus sabdariffa]|uniref:RNase H type-1 domain-containing protein n=1 Tax=Hibiscus sabdariffa TaxID=183260 RepID=A0ABR2DFI7_9ROSI